MADSASIDQIDPASVDLVGYYVDGRYVPSAASLARFAGKVHVPISVNPSGNAGVVLDGAPDNGSTGEEPGWVARRRQAGVDPTVYTTLSLWPSLIQAMNSAGVAQPHWWIADWNNQAAMISGAVAHQYATVPYRYDLSIVADYWPGIDPIQNGPSPPPVTTPQPPTPPPPPPPDLIEDDMLIISAPHDNTGSTYQDLYLLSGNLLSHIVDGTSAQAFGNAGVKTVQVTYADFQQLQADAAALKGHLTGTLNISGALNAA